MPKGRSYRKYNRRKRRYWRKRKVIPGTSGQIMPYRVFRKLPYVMNNFSLAPGAGVTAVQVFRANGLFDPDVSGVGNQPRGFDDMMALYGHYVVLGCKVTVRGVALSASTNNRLGITVLNESATKTNPIDYLEQRNSRSVLVSESDGGRSIGQVTMYWSAKKWFGKITVLTEKDLEGSATSDPSEQAYIHVHDDALGGTSTGLLCDARIEYIVCFREPTFVTAS